MDLKKTLKDAVCKYAPVVLSVTIALTMMVFMTSCGSSAADDSGSIADSAADNTESNISSQTDFDADAYYEKLQNCVSQIREITDFEPEIAIVLGSGLGQYAEQIDAETEISYSDIDGFPVTTAPGHEGKLIFGTYAGHKLVIMKGRVHYYEGYSMYDVVLPVRVLHLLGADTLILTNAVGSIRSDFVPGDFVAASDHISSYVPSPLIGENIEELGDRFTDMSYVYDSELHDLAISIGEEKDFTVHSGVLVQTTGPQYETPAEIEMYRNAGADTVGMSAVTEAIAARHMGMRICCISCVTNMAAGMEEGEISEDLVISNSDKISSDFEDLISTMLERMPEAES